MANRTWEHARTQGIEHVYLPVTLIGTGSSTAPTLGEGDPGGSYYTISRVAAGNYLLTTKDSFLAIVYKNVSSNGGLNAVFGAASQNTNGTWALPIFVANVSTSVSTVGSITGGSGYTSAPAVSFTGGAGAGATATATVAAGAVTAVTVTGGGIGYTSAPTVVFTGGGGTGAAATAVLGTNIAVEIPLNRAVRVMAVFRNSSVTP